MGVGVVLAAPFHDAARGGGRYRCNRRRDRPPRRPDGSAAARSRRRSQQVIQALRTPRGLRLSASACPVTDQIGHRVHRSYGPQVRDFFPAFFPFLPCLSAALPVNSTALPASRASHAPPAHHRPAPRRLYRSLFGPPPAPADQDPVTPSFLKKQAILLVHGVGKHAAPTKGEPGAFTTEFLHAPGAALQKFPAHKHETLADYFDLHAFNYDNRFDPMRTARADRPRPMPERRALLDDLHDIAFTLNLAAAWGSDFSQDTFFATQWLDLIYFGSSLGEKVRPDLALKLTALMGDYGIGNIHVIAHNLGTDIVHEIHGRFTIDDARLTLLRLYPKLQLSRDTR